jgi:hypothetical protein
VQKVGVMIISAFAAHTAWHWLVERWAALMKTQLPELGVETIVRAGLGAVVIVAVLWLVRMLAMRRALQRNL